ncbi:MAG: hypothetical protein V7L14_28175 [Nostoc sp.]
MGSREWGDEGAGEAGEAGEEELLIIDQCPMPNAQYPLYDLIPVVNALLLYYGLE